MYKLLIVEDEKSTREGLRDCVDWQLYNVGEVFDACNGKEAIEILVNNSIDIVLTDVVMPLIDGIELTRYIRQEGIPVKVIFISGYCDMPYLKSAFELDAIDYILKPIELAELERVMKKVVAMCDREVQQKKAVQEMKTKLAVSIPILREKFITDLLMGNIRDEHVIVERTRFLEIPFLIDDYYTVITAHINFNADGSVWNIEDREIYRMRIREVIDSILGVQYVSFCLTMRDDELVIIINSKSSISYNETIKVAQEIQRSVKDKIGVELSIGIGEEVRYIRQICRSYQKSLCALDQEYFLGKGKIIHYKDINFGESISDYYPHHLQEQIFNAIRLGKEQLVRSLVEEFFEEIQNNTGMNVEYIQTICIEFVILAQKLLLESNDIRLNIDQRKDLWKGILKQKTLSQTKEWMCTQLCDMVKQIAIIHSQRSRSIIERIKKTVQERYRDNITIQTLAQEFFITPNYLSMLFKKETGEGFKEYLTRIRVEKAKKLMQNSSLKLYEIAEAVGYTDPDYFTKVFKKYTGVTPTEYKERLN